MILAREQKLRQLVESGEHVKAHDAVDEVLALGPHNIRALKWKGDLAQLEGEFAQSREYWRRVLEIDAEDVEAIHFFEKLSIEDREAFYFTESTHGDGRRFFAYPRHLIMAVISGLIGCSLFLFFSAFLFRLLSFSPVEVVVVSFAFCVVGPWAWILLTFMRTLKDIVIDYQGITFFYRTRKVRVDWVNIQAVYLSHFRHNGEARLELVFQPHELDSKPVVILDLTEHTSMIRARSYFIAEVARVFKDPVSMAGPELPFDFDQVSKIKI